LYDTLDLEHFVGRFVGSLGAGLVVPTIGRLLRIKPDLAYVETHIVDRCNMNCRGCSHFSPIADQWFADPVKYLRDMKRLKTLFSNIRVIRIMGGEPLLHPRIERFLIDTKTVFPNADVRVVSNGLILDSMPETFWETCRANSISIDLTIYPPAKNKLKFLLELGKTRGVKMKVTTADFFFAFYNSRGNSDPEISFRQCKLRWNRCTNLREGCLYSCPISSYIDIFNRCFGTKIPKNGNVDIYAPEISGWAIKKALKKAPLTCRYCTCGWEKVPKFSWSHSTRCITDWVGPEEA
jgi:hypothetical protein